MKVRDIAEIVTGVREVSKILSPYSEPTGPPPDPESNIPDDDPNLKNAFEMVEKVYNDMKTGGVKPPPTKEEVVLFSDFFSYVGRSLVEAQKTLDGHSETYLERIRGRPHILPSVFRIPKLSAEIKFAFKEVKDEKVNLIFYSTKEEAEKQHQQSVQFDIVSVPPPQPQEIVNLTPRVVIILSPGMRKSVFDGVTNFLLPDDDSTGRKTEIALRKSYLLKNPDRVLIVEAEPQKRFYLFYAEDGQEKDIGIWHLVLEPLILEAVYKFTRAPVEGENIGVLRKDVLKFASLQAEFLKQLR